MMVIRDEEEITESKDLSPISQAVTKEGVGSITEDSPTCHQCGICCRRFKVNGGSRVDKIKFDATDEDKSEWRKEVALLKRILVKLDDERGKNGRKIHWYRCKMLWYNKDNKKWECLIYDSRPSMCKRFVPGNHTIAPRAPCRKEAFLKAQEKTPERFAIQPEGELFILEERK